jgi:hypothetical protein
MQGLMMAFLGTKSIHAYSARHDIYNSARLGNWALGVGGQVKPLESRIAAHSSNV